jgi:hypothetical protein
MHAAFEVNEHYYYICSNWIFRFVEKKYYTVINGINDRRFAFDGFSLSLKSNNFSTMLCGASYGKQLHVPGF